MKTPAVVKQWSSIPNRIRKSIRGLRAHDLAIRGGAEGWSIAEYVHHLVEDNFIACHVVLVALGKPGGTYDWSWVHPSKAWMKRLSYDRAPVESALQLFEALTKHISSLIAHNPRNVQHSVGILDTPGGVPRKTTVAQLLRAEVGHATHHLGDIESAKRSRRNN
ncbi:MAG: DinB family protein [Acidobacteriia bacterium]|nr:DinB family protein [Terriglobia bacterium]